MLYDRKLNFVIALVSLHDFQFGKMLNYATKPEFSGGSQVEVEHYLKNELDRFFLELIHKGLISDKPYVRGDWFWKILNLSIKPVPGVKIEMDLLINTARNGLPASEDSAIFKMRISEHEGFYIEVLDQKEGYGYK